MMMLSKIYHWEWNYLIWAYNVIHDFFKSYSNNLCNDFVNHITKTNRSKVIKMFWILLLWNKHHQSIINFLYALWIVVNSLRHFMYGVIFHWLWKNKAYKPFTLRVSRLPYWRPLALVQGHQKVFGSPINQPYQYKKIYYLQNEKNYKQLVLSFEYKLLK